MAVIGTQIGRIGARGIRIDTEREVGSDVAVAVELACILAVAPSAVGRGVVGILETFAVGHAHIGGVILVSAASWTPNESRLTGRLGDVARKQTRHSE